MSPSTSNSLKGADSISLKRTREGSLEPSQAEPVTTPLVAKKNRLEGDDEPGRASFDGDAETEVGAEDQDQVEGEGDVKGVVGVDADVDVGASDSTTTTKTSAAPIEGRTVGEVRRKVEKMTWKEGHPLESVGEEETVDGVTRGKDANIDDESEEKGDAKVAEAEVGKDWEKIETSEAIESGDLPKRKALDRADSSAFAEAESKRRKSAEPENQEPASTSIIENKATPESQIQVPPPPSSAPALTSTTTTAPAPTKPATFGSFSSTTSPFARTSTTTAADPLTAGAQSAPSPFASSTTTTNVFGSSPAAAGSSSAGGSGSVFGSGAGGSTSIGGGLSSGFGSYSSAFSPFAKKPATISNAEGNLSSFGDILKDKGEDKAEDKKVQMDMQDVPTGEEEEETLHQTRAKLFVMQEDGGWKERGVGLLKVNVRKSDGRGARLVMRADGVFRVILNASLYSGMTCLEDGKHVRTTVFEGQDRRLVTFRTGNAKAASDLCAVIHENVPLESRGSTEPERVAARSAPTAGVSGSGTNRVKKTTAEVDDKDDGERAVMRGAGDDEDDKEEQEGAEEAEEAN